MGAGVPLKVMVTPEKVVGSCPALLAAGGTPVTPDRIPVPLMVGIPPGEIPVFGLKLAPFTMLMLAGPLGCAVRVKLTLKLDDVALTVMVPGVPPAVTVVDACPVESVIAEEGVSVAAPEVTWKLTCTPATPLPAEFTTATVRGEAKAVSIWALC